MADAPPPAKRPISAAVAARRERARLRALPTPSSALAQASGKRARDAGPPQPPAKAVPPPPLEPPEGAPREPTAAELAAYDAAEAGRAAVRAAQARIAALQALINSLPGGQTRATVARLAALQARLAPEQAQLLAARPGAALSEAAAVALGGGGAEAAYTRRGELFLDIIPLTAACGYAAEVSQCHALCGLTWRLGDRGATNDMIVSSLRLQCGAAQARKERRESFTFVDPDGDLQMIWGTTQLIRASIQNNLPRVLQLIQLGAPLDPVDQIYRRWSALHWASSLGHEHVVAALIEGKYKGADVEQVCDTWTALKLASDSGHIGVVRMLLARGAKQQVRPGTTDTAMHMAVADNRIEVVKLLLAAPGASDALKTKGYGSTPLKRAIDGGHAEIVTLLRAAGAPEA